MYFRRAFLFPGCFRSLRRASSVKRPATNRKKFKRIFSIQIFKPNRRYSTSFDEINEQSAFDIAKRVAIDCAVNPIPS